MVLPVTGNSMSWIWLCITMKHFKELGASLVTLIAACIFHLFSSIVFSEIAQK
jgi:hypothetical protein